MSLPASAGTSPLHDLSIAAIDFDPSPATNRLVSGEPYSLLVAVENKGDTQEGPVELAARWLSDDRKEVLHTSHSSLSFIAAGQVTVVRFAPEQAPPGKRPCVLDVQIDTSPSETITTNNERTIEIKIAPSN